MKISDLKPTESPEDGDLFVTPPVSWIYSKSEEQKEQDAKDMAEMFKKMFVDTGNEMKNPKVPLPKPVEYDDTGKSVKIAERYPIFGFASLLDEVLEDFGGVSEIMKCEWNKDVNEGLLICLMNDWRVFRYNLKANEFATLSQEDRISKINRECQVFEDMDDWGHWEDLGGSHEENDKKAIEKKKSEEKMTSYGEKYADSLDDFFNGGVEAMQRMMQKNKGQSSYLEAEE